MRPYLWVFAGPNGIGKTTIAKKYLKNKIPVVNPDELKHASPLEAGRAAIKLRNSYLQEGISFAVETTLSGKNEIALIKSANEKKYKVN